MTRAQRHPGPVGSVLLTYAQIEALYGLSRYRVNQAVALRLLPGPKELGPRGHVFVKREFDAVFSTTPPDQLVIEIIARLGGRLPRVPKD